jgi:predicted DNA-binding transcriptional regulator AlpA
MGNSVRIIACPLPAVLGLNREQAAAYIGVSPSLFDKAVEAGTLPHPRLIGARNVWDAEELAARFRAIPHRGTSAENDTESNKGNAWDNARN